MQLQNDARMERRALEEALLPPGSQWEPVEPVEPVPLSIPVVFSLKNKIFLFYQIDKFIPWFDLLCGLALLVGFCTPVAAIATAGFLFSVCLTQFPGAAGALPVYYQAIEMFALLVVAFAGGGKYMSFDSVINHFCKRCCGGSGQPADK